MIKNVPCSRCGDPVPRKLPPDGMHWEVVTCKNCVDERQRLLRNISTSREANEIAVDLLEGPPCAACGRRGAHYCDGGPGYVGLSALARCAQKGPEAEAEVGKLKGKLVVLDREALRRSLRAQIMRSDAWTFQERLVIWRAMSGGLTQAQSAGMVGVGVSAWSDWESGKHAPQGASASALAVLTGIPREHIRREAER